MNCSSSTKSKRTARPIFTNGILCCHTQPYRVETETARHSDASCTVNNRRTDRSTPRFGASVFTTPLLMDTPPHYRDQRSRCTSKYTNSSTPNPSKYSKRSHRSFCGFPARSCNASMLVLANCQPIFCFAPQKLIEREQEKMRARNGRRESVWTILSPVRYRVRYAETR